MNLDKIIAGILIREPDRLHTHHIEEILDDPGMALVLAVSAAAGASNLITANPKDSGPAIILQDQSRLWMEIHKQVNNHILQQEWRSQQESTTVPQDPSSGTEEQPVS